MLASPLTRFPLTGDDDGIRCMRFHSKAVYYDASLVQDTDQLTFEVMILLSLLPSQHHHCFEDT